MISAILTGSPDCSILATDVETGAAIARLEDAHGSLSLLCYQSVLKNAHFGHNLNITLI